MVRTTDPIYTQVGKLQQLFSSFLLVGPALPRRPNSRRNERGKVLVFRPDLPAFGFRPCLPHLLCHPQSSILHARFFVSPARPLAVGFQKLHGKGK
jgi:hypothetical protein